MSAKHKQIAKQAAAILLMLAVLFLAVEAITHSQFYAHLEWLNMDNHQH